MIQRTTKSIQGWRASSAALECQSTKIHFACELSACLTTSHHNTEGKVGFHLTCEDHAGHPLSHHHRCCPLNYSPPVATLPDSRYTTSPPPADKKTSFLCKCSIWMMRSQIPSKACLRSNSKEIACFKSSHNAINLNLMMMVHGAKQKE